MIALVYTLGHLTWVCGALNGARQWGAASYDSPWNSGCRCNSILIEQPATECGIQGPHWRLAGGRFWAAVVRGEGPPDIDGLVLPAASRQVAPAKSRHGKGTTATWSTYKSSPVPGRPPFLLPPPFSESPLPSFIPSHISASFNSPAFPSSSLCPLLFLPYFHFPPPSHLVTFSHHSSRPPSSSLPPSCTSSLPPSLSHIPFILSSLNPKPLRGTNIRCGWPRVNCVKLLENRVIN